MAVIAVIGGTGFLGRHVVPALERQGHAVRVLSRRTGFNASKADPEVLRGVDAVVNLAGIKREDRHQSFENVHVELAERVVESMKAAGVRRLIHISVVVARPAPGLPYHNTKWKGEEIVRGSGLDWTILRPGVIYGAGDDMLSHLALMIASAPVFPIVGDGCAPMRPVHADDVAAAVATALQRPCSGKTYDIVGPDRLQLRDVVRLVASAMELPLAIWPIPVAFMRLPVWLMERIMTRPLSTSAQLAMLADGLDGDPDPANRDLGLKTTPFTVKSIRTIVASVDRVAPFNLRLSSIGKPNVEISAGVFWPLLIIGLVALSFAFLSVSDRWAAMTAVMVPASTLIFVRSIRRRLKPSVSGVLGGVSAGLLLYATTRVIVWILPLVWSDWELSARELYSWADGHPASFLWPTLFLIVIAEELLWRGIVMRFLMERWGRAVGIGAGAAIYALAHWASFNPLLLAAAVGCGLFWGWLFAVTDDLTVPVVSHLVWDSLCLFLLPVVH